MLFQDGFFEIIELINRTLIHFTVPRHQLKEELLEKLSDIAFLDFEQLGEILIL